MKFTPKSYRAFIFSCLLAILSLASAGKIYAQHGRNYYHNYHQRNYQPYSRGYRFNRLPPNYVHVRFGGFDYRYGDGVFVRPHGAAFVVIAPPIGIRVNILPPVYTRVYVDRHPYFYYNGTYYNQVNNNEYEVINPPAGARVSELPNGSSTVVLNGQKFYLYDNTYYREIISQDNEIWYEVVSNDEVQTNPLAQNGARFPALPYDAKTVIVAGQKYYVSQGIYYQEVIEGDRIMYEIVGRE